MPDQIKQRLWEYYGFKRRLILLALIIGPSLFAAQVMFSLLPKSNAMGLNYLISALFAVLFSWISVGFWSSLAGFVVLFRRFDRFQITKDLPAGPELPDEFRSALLFPIYNEDIVKVAEGIRTTILSLREKGLERHFDIFMLSDSTNPDVWAAEEEAWYDICRKHDMFGRFFYRRREANLKRKSGNIADFCRRWGQSYRYMIVFDADSLIEAGTMAKMVQAMEAHQEIGILQTPPKVILSRSVLARVQQFANHLYGPVFAAGLHFWQLGDAQYWGHNAIIRIKPFMDHCQLPKLPGRSPFGGEILSHDFVESALMRRAGYGVWLAYELGGSYEQSPPNLIDELARDRRWCQGNLQHTRLIFTRGFFPTHRALFINGIMSYGSALLWFFFLMASSAQALSVLFVTPDYFPAGRPSLFPNWPQYFPIWAITLLSGTAGLLFFPKLMAILLVSCKKGTRAFGGFWRMCFSVVGEVVVSTFLAPVRMLFHSLFVASTLLGTNVGWSAQNRDDSGTLWLEAVRCHWWGTLFGMVWGGGMFLFSPGFFIWLSPVVAGLVFSIPLSVWTSRVSLGERLRRCGLFLSPAETEPAPEISGYSESWAAAEAGKPALRGFARAVVDPQAFALRRVLAHQKRTKTAAMEERLAAVIEKALAGGPGSLNAKEKKMILSDPAALSELHHKVWLQSDTGAARWGLN